MTITTAGSSVGRLVREWRERRRRSQLDVSLAANLSARHLSFIETGRANPSREMIERLCEELDVPLRERNALFLAAGFAPVYRERPISDLGAVSAAIDAVLEGSVPNPAVAVDTCWEVCAANEPMWRFLDGLPQHLAGPPLNMLRATLHPDGMASQIRNFEQWRAHVVRRVRRQLERTAAPGLTELLADIEAYPVPGGGQASAVPADNDLVTPMILQTEYGELSLLYVLTVFGAPHDITLDEIAIETFFPADESTARILQELSR